MYPLLLPTDSPLSDNLWDAFDRPDTEDVDDAVETDRSRSGQASRASVGESIGEGEVVCSAMYTVCVFVLSASGVGLVTFLVVAGVGSAKGTWSVAGEIKAAAGVCSVMLSRMPAMADSSPGPWAPAKMSMAVGRKCQRKASPCNDPSLQTVAVGLRCQDRRCGSVQCAEAGRGRPSQGEGV
jgi:hypothetical protein